MCDSVSFNNYRVEAVPYFFEHWSGGAQLKYFTEECYLRTLHKATIGREKAGIDAAFIRVKRAVQ